jgi:hypothetical protein
MPNLLPARALDLSPPRFLLLEQEDHQGRVVDRILRNQKN